MSENFSRLDHPQTKMKKLLLLTTLTVLSIISISSDVLPQADKTKRERVEETIRGIGTGDRARVELKLANGARVKGVISSVGSDSFVVNVEKTSVAKTILFSDVESARKPRHGLKPRTWAIIGGAAAAVVILSITVFYPVLCDGGAGC